MVVLAVFDVHGREILDFAVEMSKLIGVAGDLITEFFQMGADKGEVDQCRQDARNSEESQYEVE